MKLTGQCLKDFEKWLQNEPKSIISNVGNVSLCMTFPYNYYQLSNSMQYGVYVDYFEQKTKYYIDIYKIDKQYAFESSKNRIFIFDTLHEAQTEAIKQVIEIYNEKHSD